jgi:hypothetical protein
MSTLSLDGQNYFNNNIIMRKYLITKTRMKSFFNCLILTSENNYNNRNKIFYLNNYSNSNLLRLGLTKWLRFFKRKLNYNPIIDKSNYHFEFNWSFRRLNDFFENWMINIRSNMEYQNIIAKSEQFYNSNISRNVIKQWCFIISDISRRSHRGYIISTFQYEMRLTRIFLKSFSNYVSISRNLRYDMVRSTIFWKMYRIEKYLNIWVNFLQNRIKKRLKKVSHGNLDIKNGLFSENQLKESIARDGELLWKSVLLAGKSDITLPVNNTKIHKKETFEMNQYMTNPIANANLYGCRTGDRSLLRAKPRIMNHCLGNNHVLDHIIRTKSTCSSDTNSNNSKNNNSSYKNNSSSYPKYDQSFDLDSSHLSRARPRLFVLSSSIPIKKAPLNINNIIYTHQQNISKDINYSSPLSSEKILLAKDIFEFVKEFQV